MSACHCGRFSLCLCVYVYALFPVCSLNLLHYAHYFISPQRHTLSLDAFKKVAIMMIPFIHLYLTVRRPADFNTAIIGAIWRRSLLLLGRGGGLLLLLLLLPPPPPQYLLPFLLLICNLFYLSSTTDFCSFPCLRASYARKAAFAWSTWPAVRRRSAPTAKAALSSKRTTSIVLFSC